MPEYTLATAIAVVIVVAAELLWARTGVFATARFWLATAIVWFFQVWVDGWLTRFPDPIVNYAPGQFWGIRFPFDIPIEDFGFGFALVTAVIVGWERAARGEQQ
jgi:lycopene cyclase domain